MTEWSYPVRQLTHTHTHTTHTHTPHNHTHPHSYTTVHNIVWTTLTHNSVPWKRKLSWHTYIYYMCGADLFCCGRKTYAQSRRTCVMSIVDALWQQYRKCCSGTWALPRGACAAAKYLRQTIRRLTHDKVKNAYKKQVFLFTYRTRCDTQPTPYLQLFRHTKRARYDNHTCAESSATCLSRIRKPKTVSQAYWRTTPLVVRYPELVADPRQALRHLRQ